MFSVPFHSKKLRALFSTSKIGILEKESQDLVCIILNLGLQALYLEVFLYTYIYKRITLF